MRWFFAALLLCASPVLAQHNHGAGHNDYLGWASSKVSNCCNNDDCGVMHDDDVRETAAGAEVKIDGQWCPVLREHYIIRGKSPDWNAPHACVGKSASWREKPPCERLLCFSGRGGV